MGLGKFGVAALFWLGRLLRDWLHLPVWAGVTLRSDLFVLANIGWPMAFRTTSLILPGSGQDRVINYFLWFAITGLLWRACTGIEPIEC